jgi:peptide/nickel transport system permease protein
MADIPRRVPVAAPLAESAWRVRVRRWRELLTATLANPTTVIGLVLIIGMLAVALFAPLLTEPNTPDPYQMPRDWGALN